MSKSYHNTVLATGADLAAKEQRAATQDEKVLQFFQKNKGKEFSPCQVWQEIAHNKPLTSIRRSITNLTTAGKLKKTGNKIIGVYGDKVNCWTLLLSSPEQTSLF